MRERWASKQVHSLGVPFVVEAALLRHLGAGQVDLAVLSWSQKEHQLILKLVEVKSRLALSLKQRMRLKKSAQFLSGFLGISTQCFLKVVTYAKR